MIELATALSGPTEHAVGRTDSLWDCAALVVLLTTAVLFVPDVRRLTRRTQQVAAAPSAVEVSPP